MLTRAMDHKPDTPEAISALPRKKGSSSQTRSRGCACSLAAVNIVNTVTACTQSNDDIAIKARSRLHLVTGTESAETSEHSGRLQKWHWLHLHI